MDQFDYSHSLSQLLGYLACPKRLVPLLAVIVAAVGASLILPSTHSETVVGASRPLRLLFYCRTILSLTASFRVHLSCSVTTIGHFASALSQSKKWPVRDSIICPLPSLSCSLSLHSLIPLAEHSTSFVIITLLTHSLSLLTSSASALVCLYVCMCNNCPSIKVCKAFFTNLPSITLTLQQHHCAIQSATVSEQRLLAARERTDQQRPSIFLVHYTKVLVPQCRTNSHFFALSAFQLIDYYSVKSQPQKVEQPFHG